MRYWFVPGVLALVMLVCGCEGGGGGSTGGGRQHTLSKVKATLEEAGLPVTRRKLKSRDSLVPLGASEGVSLSVNGGFVAVYAYDLSTRKGREALENLRENRYFDGGRTSTTTSWWLFTTTRTRRRSRPRSRGCRIGERRSSMNRGPSAPHRDARVRGGGEA